LRKASSRKARWIRAEEGEGSMGVSRSDMMRGDGCSDLAVRARIAEMCGEARRS
jgi:hypothetical protein